MSTWDDGTRPPPPEIRFPGRVLGVLRAGAIVIVLFMAVAIFLPLRLLEKLFLRQRPSVTPAVTQITCKTVCYILSLKRYVSGVPLRKSGAMVANHATWLDIFTLNAGAPLTFVSKAEVSRWAGIGWLARLTGTLFIDRRRGAAQSHKDAVAERLRAGQKLLIFAEGTSSDGSLVLPFKSTLFYAFLKHESGGAVQVQPVSLRYHAPPGQDPRFYGWWGDMDFLSGLYAVLTAYPQGSVHVTYHPPLAAADFSDRKALAKACEDQVRAGFIASAP